MSNIKGLPAYCFQVLENSFRGATTPPLQKYLDPNSPVDLSKKYPLFVTWDKFDSRLDDYNLRGCIGTFGPSKPLSSLLKDYALIAAKRDTRFTPIKESEIKLLKCE